MSLPRQTGHTATIICMCMTFNSKMCVVSQWTSPLTSSVPGNGWMLMSNINQCLDDADLEEIWHFLSEAKAHPKQLKSLKDWRQPMTVGKFNQKRDLAQPCERKLKLKQWDPYPKLRLTRARITQTVLNKWTWGIDKLQSVGNSNA
jgi:hypothetical protein